MGGLVVGREDWLERRLGFVGLRRLKCHSTEK